MYWSVALRFAPYLIGAMLVLATLFYKQEATHAREALHNFQSTVETIGKQVAARNRETEEGWKKQAVDAGARADAARGKLAVWLRSKPAGRGALPKDTGTPRGTDRKGQVCFDRGELDGALRRFVTGATGLVGEGAAAVIDREEFYSSWPR